MTEAGHGFGHGDGVAGGLGVVHGDGIAVMVIDPGRGAEGPGGVFGHAGDGLGLKPAGFGIETAGGAANDDGFGQDVMGVRIRLHHAAGNHPAFQRIDIARHHRLQGDDDLGRDQHRIDPDLRQRGMAALAGHGDLEFVGCRHQPALADREMTERNARHIVQPIEFLNLPALDQPVIEHRLRAGLAFLGGLEDDDGGAVEIARLGQVSGRAEQHRAVPVMAAGMHPPRHGRGIGQPGRLGHRQRVHIGAQRDHPTGAVAAPPDHADDAGPADAFGDLVQPEVAQQPGHPRGGAMHVELQFRMGVEIVPPGGDLGQHFGEAVPDGHDELLSPYSTVTDFARLRGWSTSVPLATAA